MNFAFFEKKVSLEYISKFIRNKGIACCINDENNLSFKLNDLPWDLFFDENNRLRVTIIFTLDESVNMTCMLQATSKTNEERFICKAFVSEYVPKDEEGKPIADAEVIKSIVFAFETKCNTRKAFEQAYEFLVHSLQDTIDLHRKHYLEYLERHNAETKGARIGFNNQDDGCNNANHTETKDCHRKIGFIQ